MTNYERLKQMSIDEMVKCNDICPFDFLSTDGICTIQAGLCDECRKRWLEQEVEE